MPTKKEEKQSSNTTFPSWILVVAVLSGLLFGGVGALLVFTLLEGWWYLWKKSKFPFTIKVILSIILTIAVIAIYIVTVIGVSFVAYYLGLNQEMNSQNVEISKTAENTTLNNTEYNFLITYPSNWEKDSISTENVILQLKSDDKKSSVTIKKYDTEYTSHNEYLQNTNIEDFKNTLKQNGQIDLIKIDESTLDGLKVFKVYYFENVSTITGDQRFKVMSIYIVRYSGKVLGINYGAYPEDFDAHFNEANAIINSIDFK